MSNKLFYVLLILYFVATTFVNIVKLVCFFLTYGNVTPDRSGSVVFYTVKRNYAKLVKLVTVTASHVCIQ